MSRSDPVVPSTVSAPAQASGPKEVSTVPARLGRAERFFRYVNCRLPGALPLGIAGSVLLALGSFGGGAIRNRGGVLAALGLDFLSYGHGAGISNIVFWIGTVLLLAAWLVLGRRTVCTPTVAADHALRRVRRCLWWWLVPLCFAAPMMSRDVYSYLMQGAMVRDGFDPYREGAAANPGPMLLEVSHDWRNTTTPYGPLHLWLGEGITRIVGDNITAGVILYKVVSLAGFAAIAWAVPRLAQRLGGDPALALWLGVANPVMVLHLVGGMHNESIMVGLVSVGLVAALRDRFVLAIGLMAIAVSLKATAAIAIPFVVWLGVHRYAPRKKSSNAEPTDNSPSAASSRPPSASATKRLCVFTCAGAVAVLETVAVVAAITWASGSSWGWIEEISGNSKVINPLALPSLLADLLTSMVQVVNENFTFNAPLGFLRTAGAVCMVVGLVIVWWLFRRSLRQAVRGIAAAYGVAFLCNSVTLPWYYASLISLLGVTRLPQLLYKWAAGLSVFLTLAFTGSGNHQLYNTTWMVVTGLVSWAASCFLFGTRHPRRRALRFPGPKWQCRLRRQQISAPATTLNEWES